MDSQTDTLPADGKSGEASKAERRALRARERYAQQKAERIANGEQVRGPGRPKVYQSKEEALEARRRSKRLYMQKKRSGAAE